MTNKTSSKTFRIRATITYQRLPTDITVTAFLVCELIDVPSLLCRCELTVCPGAVATIPASARSTTIFMGSFVERAFSAALDEKLPEALAEILNTANDQGSIQQNVTAPDGGGK
jgi:hypothetical protein